MAEARKSLEEGSLQDDVVKDRTCCCNDGEVVDLAEGNAISHTVVVPD